MNTAPPRFACDVMLGRTAKWLRMLGFDTHYDNQAEDAPLKTLCLLEKRILLTKDVALHGLMPAGTSRLVEAVYPRQQMHEIVSAFHLHRFTLPPRCSVCNGELAAADKESIEDLVPPYVFRTQTHFQRCIRCKKIYWQGTHLGRINQLLEEIKRSSR